MKQDEQEPLRPPPLVKMAANLSTSALSWLKGGCALASSALANERLEICKPCNQYDAAGFGGAGRCLNCGCMIPAKLRLATESCPLGKW